MSTERIVIEYDQIVTETALAWLFETTEGNIWLPKSECDIEPRDNIVEVPEWLAIEKGLA